MQVLIFDFLARFVEEADTLGMSESQAFVALLKFLRDSAEQQFQAIRNGARLGGVACWPEAVRHLILICACSII